MATKSEELADGCLSKVAEDEPVFVLRARDVLAAPTVMFWVWLARLGGVSGSKRAGAVSLYHQMRAWQYKHGRRKPD